MTQRANQDEPFATSVDWRTIGRILLKAAVLLILVNLLFAACRPLDTLGRISAYNRLFPGRDRLPYGEQPAQDYNLTLNNIPAMFASQSLARPKAADEFRVVIVGDSGTWGWLLNSDETLAAQLNRLGLMTADGRRIVAYNLGYPVLSLTKDLMILDESLAFYPDLVVWPVTLQSFARTRQLDHPLLQNNAGQVRELIDRFRLNLDPNDPRLADRSLPEETIVGRRRDLADLLRLQAYGLAWAATGLDQDTDRAFDLRASDLESDAAWLDVPNETELDDDDLALDVLSAGVDAAAGIPVLVINEPMFISDGANSDIRYNAFYPRWAYDQYRQLLHERASAAGLRFVDLWDAIDPQRFTDTPVHLDSEGTRQFADLVAPLIVEAADSP